MSRHSVKNHLWDTRTYVQLSEGNYNSNTLSNIVRITIPRLFSAERFDRLT